MANHRQKAFQSVFTYWQKAAKKAARWFFYYQDFRGVHAIIESALRPALAVVI